VEGALDGVVEIVSNRCERTPSSCPGSITGRAFRNTGSSTPGAKM